MIVPTILMVKVGSLLMSDSMAPVILHIPHSSTVIPSELRDQFIISTEDLKEEIRLITDHYTDELFAGGKFKDSAVTFPVSRICVDPERFRDDAQEVMAEKGMGWSIRIHKMDHRFEGS